MFPPSAFLAPVRSAFRGDTPSPGAGHGRTCFPTPWSGIRGISRLAEQALAVSNPALAGDEPIGNGHSPPLIKEADLTKLPGHTRDPDADNRRDWNLHQRCQPVLQKLTATFERYREEIPELGLIEQAWRTQLEKAGPGEPAGILPLMRILRRVRQQSECGRLLYIRVLGDLAHANGKAVPRHAGDFYVEDLR